MNISACCVRGVLSVWDPCWHARALRKTGNFTLEPSCSLYKRCWHPGAWRVVYIRDVHQTAFESEKKTFGNPSGVSLKTCLYSDITWFNYHTRSSLRSLGSYGANTQRIVNRRRIFSREIYRVQPEQSSMPSTGRPCHRSMVLQYKRGQPNSIITPRTNQTHPNFWRCHSKQAENVRWAPWQGHFCHCDMRLLFGCSLTTLDSVTMSVTMSVTNYVMCRDTNTGKNLSEDMINIHHMGRLLTIGTCDYKNTHCKSGVRGHPRPPS